MKKALVGTAVSVAVILAAWSLWYVKMHGFSARAKPTRYEEWAARHLRRLAIEPDARDRKNPVAQTELNIAEARDHFADHCAICHGNDGAGKTMIGQNLYPPAPDMRGGETQRLTDGELFNVVKNGVRFTGMPGWGGEDEGNWKLVLFIRHLPQLAAEERRLMNEVNHLDDMDMDDQDHGAMKPGVPMEQPKSGMKKEH